jgi:hypothetical protein
MNEQFIDNIITNLKVLGLVQINEKLSIRKGHLYIDYFNNFQFLKRWFNRDSREVVLVYLGDLIRNISILYSKIDTYQENKWILTRILTEMEPALVGLNNLKTTYSEDPMTMVMYENYIIKFKELSQQGRSMTIPEKENIRLNK